MQVPSWNIINFLSLGLKNIMSQNIRKFHFSFQGRISFISRFCWKVQGSISGNIRYAFFWENRGIHFHFQKCKEFFGGVNFFGFLGLGWEVQGFIPRNSRKFLVLQLETFISWNISHFFWGGGLFLFLRAWAGKCAR